MRNLLRRIKELPADLMVLLTRHNRSKVVVGQNFDWASDNWTHNIFRVYELIFWRRTGIHAETTSWTNLDGSTGQMAHSTEGACVIVESAIRAYLKSWKFVPFKVYVPVMQTPSGFPIPVSPWLFSIIIDTTTQDYGGSAGTTLNVAHTAVGADRFAWAGFFYQNASTTTVSTMKYDGVSMVATANTPQTIPANGNNSQAVYLYGLAAPSTTTNANVEVVWNASLSASYITVTTYSGCQSSSTADASTSASGTAAGSTLTLTTVADNAWIYGFWRCEIGSGTAGANTTMRYNNGDGGSGDTNAAQTPAGSKSVAYSFASAIYGGIAASFAPSGTPVFGAISAVSTSQTPTSVAVSGSNTIGYVYVVGDDAADNITAVTWNGVSMTKLAVVQTPGDRYSSVWWVANPASSTTISFTGGSFWRSFSFYYKEAAQTGQPDSSNTGTSTNSTVITVATTVVASNCWYVMCQKDSLGGETPTLSGVLASMRATTDEGGISIGDSNSAVSTGSQSGTMTGSSSTAEHGAIAFSIKPFSSASGPTNLKTYNTNAAANIKTMNTNVIANVKTFDTNA